MTPARPAGLAVPTLAGIPDVHGSAQGRDVRAAIALALLDAGVANPALWRRSWTVPDTFIATAVKRWVAARVDDVTLEYFPMHVRLDYQLDPWVSYHPTVGGPGDDAGEIAGDDPLFLALESEFAGFFPIAAMFEWLGRFDPQLPATVYHHFTALKRIAYVYDWWEAREHDEMLVEGWGEGEEEEVARYREENPAIEIPACLDRKPLTERQVARRRRWWPREVCAVVDAAHQLEAAAKAVPRETKREWMRRHAVISEGDYERPLPTLVIANEEYDRVCACFDDEMQSAGQMPAEPLHFWIIERPTPAAFRKAFGRLELILAAFTAAARLFAAVPGRGKISPDSLAAVLEAQAAGLPEMRVRVA